MKTILFSAILLLSLPIYAQNIFQRTYGNQGLERGYQVAVRNENEIYLLGLACNWDSIIGCIGYSIRLIEIDSLGKIIRDKNFVAPD
jgi:hypothetical protein